MRQEQPGALCWRALCAFQRQSQVSRGKIPRHRRPDRQGSSEPRMARTERTRAARRILRKPSASASKRPQAWWNPIEPKRQGPSAILGLYKPNGPERRKSRWFFGPERARSFDVQPAGGQGPSGRRRFMRCGRGDAPGPRGGSRKALPRGRGWASLFHIPAGGRWWRAHKMTAKKAPAMMKGTA